MKAIGRFNVLLFFLLAAYLLSACSGTAIPATGSSDESVSSPVAFTGLVENIVGDQWTINGVTVTVDPAVVQNDPFSVGDQVKVEGVVSQDGALTISRVEPASPEDLSTLPEFGTGSNANSNDANANDNGNTNDDNSNNANSNDTNANDDNGNDSNANDDNGNDSNSNDDGNTNDDNGNDDNGNDSNSNDDSNDNDSNSNDDDDSGSNSNDDNDNDDNENDD